MRLALAAAAAVALAGCQTTALRPVARPGATDRAGLATLASWQAFGRVAVRTEDSGWNASFDWREQGDRGEVGIRGAFGSSATRILLSAERIRIDDGRSAPLELAAPFAELEPELTTRLGFPLPLTALRFWLLGIPEPDLPSEPAADGFRQAGWQVLCSDFAAVGGSVASLPTRLVLSRGSARIRVIIDRWQVGGG
jgi:outer membrane lipoprotein LolB